MKKLRYFTLAALAAAGTAIATAVPADPEIVVKHQADGTTVAVRQYGDEFGHHIFSTDGYPLLSEGGVLYFASLDSRGGLIRSGYKASERTAATEQWLRSLDRSKLQAAAADASSARRAKSVKRRNPGLHASSFPHLGSPKALVILVEYQDEKCTLDNAHEYFSEMLTRPGFSQWGATGSAYDYFNDASHGLFTPQFDMYGPVTLPENMAYYGANTGPDGDVRPEEMVIHACQILDPQVDFSEYDHDGDGLIDNVFLFYAGRGENSDGSEDTVWPHSWDVRAAHPDEDFIFDGVQLGHYACTNEWKSDRPDGIGTFIHEFSHVLGLPDLYTTDYSTASFTPGAWSVLDYGPYNNKSRTPSGYSVYERYALDWIEPLEIGEADNASLLPIGDVPEAYILKTSNPDEFFLFENRQQKGWDTYLPGHGMLVWHIDYDAAAWEQGGINNDNHHQRVDLIEADKQTTAATRAGDSFPGTAGVTTLSAASHGAFSAYCGDEISAVLTDIAESRKGVVTFRINGGLPDSAIPEFTEPAEVGSYAFTLAWKPVAEAEEYFVEVSRQGEELPFAEHTLPGETTTLRIEDIAPETTYRAVISCRQAGKGVSRFSEALEITTGPTTFEWYAPQAQAPDDIADVHFTASWLPLEGATDYFVTLFDKADITTDDTYFDFNGGRDCLPASWECSSEIIFEQAANSGQSVPSLRMNASGAHIASDLFDKDIHSISFWHRGVGSSEGNPIAVSALADGLWVDVATVEVSEQAGGKVVEIDNFPNGSRAFRIEYKGVGTKKGPIAFDDLTVRLEESYTKTIVNGVENVATGGATSLRLADLTPATVYYFTVRAFDGLLYSRESQPIRVRTLSEGSAVAEINGDSADGPVEYYTLQGIRVTRPCKGCIYIVRSAGCARLVAF